jgi:hypothetical protein
LIQRELLLIRVSTLGREYVQQHLQSAITEENGQEEATAEELEMVNISGYIVFKWCKEIEET